MKFSRLFSNKKAVRAGLVGIIGIGMLGVAVPAQAEPAPVTVTEQGTPSQINDLQNLLTRFSVPADQQASLIQKANDGVPWDVYLEGKTPVSVDEKQIIDGFDYTIKRYADGSVAASGIEIPVEVAAQDENGMQTFGLQYCKITGGSGYSVATGCQISGMFGSAIIGVSNMSYTIVNGGYDTIGNVGNGFQSCLWPVLCTTPLLVGNFGYEDSQGPGWVKWQSDMTTSGVHSWNAWVQLNVGNNSAWQTNS